MQDNILNLLTVIITLWISTSVVLCPHISVLALKILLKERVYFVPVTSDTYKL